MSIKSYLGNSYKLSSSQNFDEYMRALGVGAITRKMGNAVTPVVTLTEKDGVYTLTTASTFKTTHIKFKPGEEFDEETLDGRKVKSVVHIDGNKLTHIQRGEKTTTIVREFTDNQMKTTLSVGNVVSVRTYDKTN